MFSSLSLAFIVSFVVGTAIVIAIAMRAARTSRADGSIAQVLYNAEHPEKTR